MMRMRPGRLVASAGFLFALLASSAVAQDRRANDDPNDPWFQPNPFVPIDERYVVDPDKPSHVRGAAEILAGAGNGLPNVMITGYWPPTNEMVRRFSTSATQNPQGWIGANWEGRGYNVYSFFPEFPQGLGRGAGDLEVDYQDSSADWWLLVDVVKPVGIVTFSRAGNDRDWEMEGGNRVYPLNQWTPDYLNPTRPTPELPSSSEPFFNERFSSQPMQAIVDAVAAQVPTLNAFIEPIDPSAFLSNYIGYHGNWYQDLHNDPLDPLWCATGGHIHVGYAMTLPEAVAATEVTLRVVLTALDERRAVGDLNCDGVLSVGDISPFVLTLTDPPAYLAQYPACNINRADTNFDNTISVGDIANFVGLLVQQ
ncbi:MAG: hypothetical protein SF069_18670 [Phycisphaerae bacterium]|nr:hypothetical protein [Phycisphaerae bacterium]